MYVCERESMSGWGDEGRGLMVREGGRGGDTVRDEIVTSRRCEENERVHQLV